MPNKEYFYKENVGDKIWWYKDPEITGQPAFSFDKNKLYYLFRDYPYKLTQKEKAIFDKENPYWAKFFKDRQ